MIRIKLSPSKTRDHSRSILGLDATLTPAWLEHSQFPNAQTTVILTFMTTGRHQRGTGLRRQLYCGKW